MSNKTPEANEPAATASAPKRHAPKSTLHKHLFWGSRILEALLPFGFFRSKSSAGQSPRTPQNWTRFVPLAIFVAVIGGVLLMQLSLRKPSVDCSFKIPKPVKGAIPGCIQLEVAQTQSALIRGLSGRTQMARDQGMLFIFPDTDRQCIWMKEMHFNLDIIWLSPDKRVQHIEKDVSPDTFPESFCVPGSKYVIEVNAGITDAGGIQVGQSLKL